MLHYEGCYALLLPDSMKMFFLLRLISKTLRYNWPEKKNYRIDCLSNGNPGLVEKVTLSPIGMSVIHICHEIRSFRRVCKTGCT